MLLGLAVWLAVAMRAESNVLPLVRLPRFPRPVRLNGRRATLRPLVATDRRALLELVESLEERDRMIVLSEAPEPGPVDAWLAEIDAARNLTLVLESRGRIIAFGSLRRRYLSWTRHRGEILVLVREEYRGRRAGSLLTRELLSVAPSMGMRRVAARVFRDRALPHDVWRRFGFSVDALLPDWVMDEAGMTHDLLLLSHDFATASQRHRDQRHGDQRYRDQGDRDQVPPGAGRITR